MKTALGIWFSLAAVACAAGLEFSEELKDLKASADAETITADFKFTNKGDKTITIAKTDAGCSCMTVKLDGGKLKYAPGESGVIRTSLEMGNFSGTVDKMIGVWMDSDPADSPSKKLTLRVHIPVLVNLEPKTLNWQTGDKLEPKIIKISMAGDKPIRVLGVKGSSALFSYDIKPEKEGEKYDLVITPLATDSPTMSVVRIETDCDITKHRVQQAFSVIRKPSGAQAAAKQ